MLKRCGPCVELMYSTEGVCVVLRFQNRFTGHTDIGFGHKNGGLLN